MLHQWNPSVLTDISIYFVTDELFRGQRCNSSPWDRKNLKYPQSRSLRKIWASLHIKADRGRFWHQVRQICKILSFLITDYILVTLCFSFQKDFKLLITTHKVYYRGMPHCNSFTIIWPSAQKPQCNWGAKMWVYLETSFCFPAGSESLTGSRLSLNRLRDRSPSPVRTKQDRASISSCPDMVGHTVRGNWEHSLTIVFVTIQAINGDLIKVSF